MQLRFCPSQKHIDEELIKEVSDDQNDDQQWDSEYKVKKKKGKFYINKRRARKQNERRRQEKVHVRKFAKYINKYFIHISIKLIRTEIKNDVLS